MYIQDKYSNHMIDRRSPSLYVYSVAINAKAYCDILSNKAAHVYFGYKQCKI